MYVCCKEIRSKKRRWHPCLPVLTASTQSIRPHHGLRRYWQCSAWCPLPPPSSSWRGSTLYQPQLLQRCRGTRCRSWRWAWEVAWWPLGWCAALFAGGAGSSASAAWRVSRDTRVRAPGVLRQLGTLQGQERDSCSHELSLSCLSHSHLGNSSARV